jgi:hypothetical protein
VAVRDAERRKRRDDSRYIELCMFGMETDLELNRTTHSFLNLACFREQGEAVEAFGFANGVDAGKANYHETACAHVPRDTYAMTKFRRHPLATRM